MKAVVTSVIVVVVLVMTVVMPAASVEMSASVVRASVGGIFVTSLVTVDSGMYSVNNNS